MLREEWRDVPDYPLYEVSNRGNVRRKPKNLVPGKMPSGHVSVALSKGTGKPQSKSVHRLVALAFIDKVQGRPWVNHKNGKPADNRVENLEWVTPGENIMHGYRSNGRRAPSEIRCMAVTLDGEPVMSFRSFADAGKHFNVWGASIRTAADRKGTSCGYRWIRYADS